MKSPDCFYTQTTRLCQEVITTGYLKPKSRNFRPDQGRFGRLGRFGGQILPLRWLFTLLLVSGALLGPLSGQEALTAEQITATIDDLSQELLEHYVFPDKAREMSELLHARLKDGTYFNNPDPHALADQLTRDMQSVSHDRHLRASYKPEQNSGMRAMSDQEEPREMPSAMQRRMKRSNYGFQEVKILPGNVGYLDLRGFFDPAEGGEAAEAAMNYLANAEAIIFDLRRNGGGSPGMIQLLTSYLYDRGERVHLNNFYFRPSDDTSQTWTLPYVPGKRNPEAEVFVLTSGRTFSAAEEFTYNLKNLERATIVGETTGGGAHPGGTQPIGDSFVAFIATGRAINPITNTNWEGVGVSPHVDVPADKAFDQAYLLALEKLAEQARDEDKSYFNWHADLLRASQEPIELTEAQIAAVCGLFGIRKIFRQGDGLYYAREDMPPFKLIPLSENLFVLDGETSARIRLELENDKAKALVLEFENGRKQRFERTIP